MQERAGLMRLAVRGNFGEAANRAKRLAELSGLGILVARGRSGFEIWVPAAAHDELAAQLQEMEGGVVEAFYDEQDERLHPEIVDDGADYEIEDDGFEDYQQEVWSEIAEDIEDERENWAASEEDGWFYRD